MKKKSMLKTLLLLGFIVWIIMLIKQQINISQYKDDIKVLEAKIEAEIEELDQNKQNLEEEKANTNSPEYIEKLAREKLGMYLQNERVYIDSNM